MQTKLILLLFKKKIVDGVIPTKITIIINNINSSALHLFQLSVTPHATPTWQTNSQHTFMAQSDKSQIASSVTENQFPHERSLRSGVKS